MNLFTKQSLSIGLIWIFHISGLIGIIYTNTSWFIKVTPLNLLLSFVLLVINSKWNKKLFSEFKKMRIETNKSFTNFLLVKFDRVKVNSAKVFRLLAKSGILVRKMDVYGIKNSLRITIGTTSENITLIKKMRKILNVR